MSEETKKKLSDIYAKLEEDRKTIKEHSEGDSGEGIIKDIQIGIVRNFVAEENLPKWKGSIDAQCMQMEIETPDGFTIKQIMTFSAHPNSNMQRWRKRYNKYPELEDKVKLRHDGNFWQLN